MKAGRGSKRGGDDTKTRKATKPIPAGTQVRTVPLFRWIEPGIMRGSGSPALSSPSSPSSLPSSASHFLPFFPFSFFPFLPQLHLPLPAFSRGENTKKESGVIHHAKLILSRGWEGKTEGSSGEKWAQGAYEETPSIHTSHSLSGFWSPVQAVHCKSYSRAESWAERAWGCYAIRTAAL